MTEKEVILLAIDKCLINKYDGVRLYNYIKNDGKHICGICEREIGKRAKKNIDHIIPKVWGGTDNFNNLQFTHRSCNRKKDNLLFSHILKD